MAFYFGACATNELIHRHYTVMGRRQNQIIRSMRAKKNMNVKLLTDGLCNRHCCYVFAVTVKLQSKKFDPFGIEF